MEKSERGLNVGFSGLRQAGKQPRVGVARPSRWRLVLYGGENGRAQFFAVGAGFRCPSCLGGQLMCWVVEQVEHAAIYVCRRGSMAGGSGGVGVAIGSW